MERTYTIGQAAGTTGVTTHTLRYYERIGLIAPIARESGGRRLYSEADIGFVGFLTLLRAAGMPIRDMLAFVRLTREGDATVGARAEMLARHREVLRRQLDRLVGCQSALDSKIEFYRARQRELEEAQAFAAIAD